MKVKLLHPNAKLPTRADQGSNGYDLYACEDVFIPMGETKIIPTGISIDLRDYNQSHLIPVFKIEDRSSMAIKGLRTGAGVIDYSFSGEIKVVIHNLNCQRDVLSTIYGGDEGYKIKAGDKIAQGLIYYTFITDVIEVNDVTTTERGSSGFWSSGR
jgi:deoxyuridine 5'-triphosphate nucleotidohydrolase